MRHRTKLITLTLVIFLTVAVLMSACGRLNETQATSGPVPEEAQLDLTAFKIAKLAINPVEVNPGVEVVITAEVTNTTDTEDEYSAKLRIDDVKNGSLPAFLDSEEVTIAAGKTQLMSFLVSTKRPGTYRVTWGELTGEYVVVEPDETAESDNPGTDNSGPITAPDFTGVDVVTSETISLAQFQGSIIVLNFVNYGCSTSLNQVVSAQLLAIRELREQRDDFMPISIFCGCCPEDTLREFATQNDLTWPWILDTDYSIIERYAAHLGKYGYPTLIFIDKEQNIGEVTGYCDVSTLGLKIDETS